VQANVGISMGIVGTQAAMEAADIVWWKTNSKKLPVPKLSAKEHSKLSKRI
jgi:Cd2+/Zn2+-exporting ATPase